MFLNRGFDLLIVNFDFSLFSQSNGSGTVNWLLGLDGILKKSFYHFLPVRCWSLEGVEYFEFLL